MATPVTDRPNPARLAVHGLVAGYGAAPVLRDVDLVVDPGEMVVLLGPSGCGKTTLLRCVAGLEVPSRGTIHIGDQLVSEAGRAVAPERRGVGMVFQDGALFPHLSVAQNVGYSLGRGGRRHPRVRELLELVGLAEYAERLPGTLSGGQQQRVAIARALAPSPGVLLFDEPFSSLDAALRVRVRTEVRRLLDDVGVTSVFVTHDQEEAFALGRRVGVMRDGVLEQIGTPSEVYDRPRTAWVAEFVGEANLVDGDAANGKVDTAIGRLPLDASCDDVRGPVVALCRPEHLELRDGGDASIVTVEYYGRDTRCDVRLPDGATLTVRRPGAVAYRPGDRVAVVHGGSVTVAWPRPVG